MGSVLSVEDDLWAAEAAVWDPIANILLEDLSAIATHTIFLIIFLDVAPYFSLTDVSELLLTEEHIDILNEDICWTSFIVALVGTFKLYLSLLFIQLLFSAEVGNALPTEGVPAIMKSEIGSYYVLTDDALWVYLLVYLIYLILTLLNYLDVTAQLYSLVPKVYLGWELCLSMLRFKLFCYL